MKPCEWGSSSSATTRAARSPFASCTATGSARPVVRSAVSRDAHETLDTVLVDQALGDVFVVNDNPFRHERMWCISNAQIDDAAWPLVEPAGGSRCALGSVLGQGAIELS